MAFNPHSYPLCSALGSGEPSARKAWLALLGALFFSFSSAGARAQSADADADADVYASVDDSAAVTAEAEVGEAESGFRSNYFELGVFLGGIFPSKRHNLYDLSEGRERFRRFAPEAGVRVAYFPIGFIGAEVEAMGALTKTTSSDTSARLWALRAHGVLQYPARVTPFVLVGGGRFGVSSDAVGSDGDPLFHFGGGLKFAINDLVGLRVDVRDNLTQRYNAEDNELAHHVEAALGLSFSLDVSPKPEPVAPPPPPPDTDGDGVPNASDRCPNEAGPAPEGCPLPGDSDGDGFTDDKDACPNEPGIVPDGCPDPDPDKDGVKGDADQCPNEPGIEPDGCPDPDPDKDGVKGEADKCPKEPETKNGFEDDDGCPDTVPEKVKKYSGVIPGIEFDTGKSTIRPSSRGILDDAIKVLKEYPSLRIGITGHTDDTGNRQANLILSQQRADAVKGYLVSEGIDPSRIETRGAGPDEPLLTGKTRAARQKNRRIEFKLLTQ